MRNETEKDKFWNSINTAIYNKCMKLAKQANDSQAKAHGPYSFQAGRLADICHDARYWIDKWIDYSKGEISEEQIKALFLLYGVGSDVSIY